MIEVRSGIHPDLTGRENVFLYGSLLGLQRREVARKFDEIVAFAEVGEAIDRQVKFFSSGMQMRLGFAVAAFLEPDVLLVDEVLAVGDASFQQKCLDRMRYVLSQGTTLVYVSHDLATVEATCARGLWLNDGAVKAQGPVGDVLDAYRRSFDDVDEFDHPESAVIRLLKAEALAAEGDGIRSDETLDLRLAFESGEAYVGRVQIGVTQSSAHPIFLVARPVELAVGETAVHCRIAHLPLPHGRFTLWVGVAGGRKRDLLPWHRAASFQVEGPRLDPPPRGVVRAAPVHVDAAWDIG